MEKRPKEGTTRLCVGLALNIGLWVVNPGLNKSGSIGSEGRLSLIAGSLAIATLVFVIPVFWRGAPWQAPIAFVLIFFLPGLALLTIVGTLLRYW